MTIALARDGISAPTSNMASPGATAMVKYPFLVALPGWAFNIVDHGGLAVDLFFVLSGFILAYTYLADQRPLDRRSFWVARFARVYPVYALTMLLTAPLFLQQVTSGRVIAAELVLVPTMLHSWVPGLASLWNTPA
ncbi:MAG: acyltransferase family protein [Chloroflexota bacterium]